MRRSPSLQAVSKLSLLLTLLAAVVGCKAPTLRTAQIDSTAGMFDSAQVRYAVDVSRLGEPISVARVEGQNVSYEAQPTAPSPGTAQAELSVTYPHPEAAPGYARCQVVLHAKPAAGEAPIRSTAARMADKAASLLPDAEAKRRAGEQYEVWTLDVPKLEIDRAVSQLADSGFFRGAKSTTRGVEINATVDGANKHGEWRPIPEFDALVQRVRTYGQLQDYHRPTALAKRTPAQFSSVTAYRQQIAPASHEMPQQFGQAANTVGSAVGGFPLSETATAQPPVHAVPALPYAPAGAVTSIPRTAPPLVTAPQPMTYGTGTFKPPALPPQPQTASRSGWSFWHFTR